MDSGSLFRVSHRRGIGDFRKFISVSHTVTSIFHDTWRNDSADERINQIHLGTDPADIRIRIQIKPENQIRITDQIFALAEFSLSECYCWQWNYSDKRKAEKVVAGEVETAGYVDTPVVSFTESR